MSIAIIANPLAGRGRGKKTAQATEELLAKENVDFELLFTEYEGHAIELARQASKKHDLVVALGGDGTIREVLEGTWQNSTTLGIIPGGTGNDYSRGLGIPREVEPAVKNLLEGEATLFDVGVDNGRVFGQLACVGFPVDVIMHVNNNRDGFWKGSLAFLTSVVATIRDLRSHPVRITIDGQVLEKEVVGIFAMNMPYGGGGMKFVPQASYDSGIFHVLVIEAISKLDLAVTLPKIYSGKHIPHPAITILTGREIRVEGVPTPIMLDGDIFFAEEMNCKIIPQTTKIVIPKTPAR